MSLEEQCGYKARDILIFNPGRVAACLLTRVRLFATPRTVDHQAPLSMGLPRQEYWHGLAFPSPGGFWTQGSNPRLLHWQADSLPLRRPGSPKPG